MKTHINVEAAHHYGFEYMATVRIGNSVIWRGIVYGTDGENETHSVEAAQENAISVVAYKLEKLLANG